MSILFIKNSKIEQNHEIGWNLGNLSYCLQTGKQAGKII